MTPRLAVLAVSISSAALAQTTTGAIQIQIQGSGTAAVGPKQCGSNLTVTWKISNVVTVCSTMPLWVTPNSTCSDAPTAGDFQFDEVTTTELQSMQGTSTLAVSNLPGLADADAGTGCGVAVDKAYKVCGAFSGPGGYPASCAAPTTVKTSSPPTLTYDGVAPPAPTISEIVPLDSALKVSVQPGTGTTLIHVEVKEETAPDSAYRVFANFTSDVPSGRVDGLTNGTAYTVRATGEDAAQNVSGPSNVLTGTPIPTEGFWGAYRRVNTGDTGGCSVAGGLAVPGLAVALGVFLSRRRRR